MATKADIEKVLYDWFTAVTGLTTIWSDQPVTETQDGAIEPNLPYATLKIIAGPMRGGSIDTIIEPDEILETMNISGERIYTLSCQVLGNGALDYMILAQNSLQNPDVRLTLNRRQSNIVEVSTITDSAEYTITIDGIESSYTSDADATALEIRDGLIAAINANTSLDGISAEDESATELIITGKIGIDFAISVDAKLTEGDQVNAVGISPIRDLGIVDVAELLETSWLPRQSMDVQFRMTSNVTFAGGIIETIEATGTVGNIPVGITVD